MEIDTETTEIKIKYSIYTMIGGLLSILLSVSSFLLRDTIILRGRLSPEVSYIIGATCLGGLAIIVPYNYLFLSNRIVETRGDIAMGTILLFIFPLIIKEESQAIPALVVILSYYLLRLLVITLRGDFISSIKEIKRETNIRDESNIKNENEKN